jgi:hypothetical protein
MYESDRNKEPAVLDGHASATDDTNPRPTVVVPKLGFYNFMRLSRELRLIIWDMAIRDQTYHQPGGGAMCYLQSTVALREYVKVSDIPSNPKFLPAICFVSKKNREEEIAAVIEGSKFMIASIHDNNFLQIFLKAEPGRLELCRDLSFDFFSRFPSSYEKNADLELAALCTGLHTIKMTFHFEPLTYFVQEDEEDPMVMSRRARALNELFEEFRLQRLLDCKCLKNITIEHTSQNVAEATKAGVQLGELLKTKFSQLSPPQTVTVYYTRQPPRPRFRMYY